MLKNLEHHEHAGHLAHHGAHHGDHAEGGHEAAAAQAAHNEHGNQMAALLVAMLAAGLAVVEQGAKHAEIRVEQNAILAADSWNQYQGKSVRGTFSKDLAGLIPLMGPVDAELTEKRAALVEKIKKDAERFESDPKDGKEAIAERAHRFEEARDHALEQTHAYHNGSAAMELGIVLTTASAITKSKMLIYAALCLGLAGGVLGILGYVAPEWGAF